MPEKNTPNLPSTPSGLFLRDDGTWQAAGGSFAGDMDDIPNGTTYVKTENNYTDAEVTKVSNLSGTNTGDNAVNSLYSGLAASKLDVPTGTPDGTKYLRDDNTWQAVSGGSGLTQQQVEGLI